MLIFLIKLVNIVLFVTLFISIYLIVKRSIERQYLKKVSQNIDIISKNYERRILKLHYKQYYRSNNRRKNYIQGLDILIEKANIRRIFKIFTTEFLIFSSILIGIIVTAVSFRYLYNIFAALVLGVVAYFIPAFLLKIISNRNAKLVDNYLVHYVGLLENFCYIKDDIVYAITNVTNYLREPLKTYNFNFVLKVNYGISVYDSLEDLKNKVDNKRFKMLIKNLQLCSQYSGKYKDVLEESKESLKDYKKERNKRKKAVNRTRATILAMMIFSISIIYGTINMNPSLVTSLKIDPVGQLIVVYIIIVFIYAIYKAITIEKFDY